VEALVARGESGIKVLDMAPSTLFEEEQKDGRVVFFKASILDSSQLEEALKGVDTVFHTAALVNFWERFPHLYSKTHAINVTGTEVRNSIYERGHTLSQHNTPHTPTHNNRKSLRQVANAV